MTDSISSRKGEVLNPKGNNTDGGGGRVAGGWSREGSRPLFDGNIYRLVSVKELENPPIINKPSDRSERHDRLALAYRKVQHVAKISLFFPPAGLM